VRRAARGLLLLFVFAIPWAYSLDLGEPWGNIARVLGVLLLLAAIPAVLETGALRRPGAVQWATLLLLLWYCATYFWSLAPVETLASLRGSLQKMMVVWLVWELAESARDLRLLLRAQVAGCGVLALLTLAALRSPEAWMEGRLAALGQDPNDAAYFLNLGLPLAALLACCESSRALRWLAAGLLPLSAAAALLTASRGGFLGEVIALAGCAVLLSRRFPRAVLAGVLALPVLAGAGWQFMPRATIERLATIPGELQSGGLNQRWNIWGAGWEAFRQAPLGGSGAGVFVHAARLAPLDTAHNAALSVAVHGGLCALLIAAALAICTVREAGKSRGNLRLALAAALLVTLVSSLVATVDESRSTWLLAALAALAGRLTVEDAPGLERCFGDAPPSLCGPERRVQEGRESLSLRA
jgi:hypothetical protein